MFFLLCVTSSFVHDFDLVAATGDMARFLDLPAPSFRGSRFRHDAPLHYAIGTSPAVPIPLNGTASQSDAVLSELHRVQAERVLELQFGQGRSAVHLAAAAPNVSFVAFDSDANNVVHARMQAEARNLSNVDFRWANAGLFMSCSSAPAFDVVYAIESIDVVIAYEFLKMLAHCVRPGGSVVLVDAFVADDATHGTQQAQRSLRLVQAGFDAHMMPPLAQWRVNAPRYGFSLRHSWNWTSHALPFFDRQAQAVRRVMPMYRLLPASTQGYAVGTLMLPHALRHGALTYGGMILKREL